MSRRNAKASPRKSPRKPAARTGRARRPGGRASGLPAKAETVSSQLPPVSAADTAAAQAKFEQGILARGEAIEAGKPLPPGATHVIIGKTRGGGPILKRKRFSLK